MTARKLKFIFIIFGLALMLFPLPFSGAISGENMDRGTAATVVDDASGALKLVGFNNPSSIKNVNKKYVQVGTITNNTNQGISLTVTLAPDFSLQNNKNCRLGIKIGGIISEFSLGSSAASQVTLALSPGMTVPVEASLSNNQAREVSVSYSFNAVNTSGSYTMQAYDTPGTPRRMKFK